MSGSARWAWGVLVALLLLPLGALLVRAAPQERQRFPHEEHAGMFPLCAGCHVGIETGEPAAYYPPEDACAGCHDGVAFELVTFAPPPAVPSNLIFDHVVHARAMAGSEEPPLGCVGCHATPGAPRMTVEPLEAGRCLVCHARPADDHLVDAPCATCHVPLASTALPLERIEGLPVPEDHESGRFLRELHGQLVVEEPARCATCHTADRCVACHVDADRPEIALLPSAPPTLALPPMTAHYPVPASHRTPAFLTQHGRLVEAEGPARCATCHTRDDCASCHLPPLPAGAAALPAASRVVAPGVGLSVGVPESHRAPRFERTHGPLAASDPASCASCHSEPFCTQCHQAPQRPTYHDENFVARHAAAAWGRTTECANCHEVQVYCRGCHLHVGFGAQGRLGPGFHDAEPFWLLRHGQPARQSLESCASCHQQRDCLQCHSELGAFRVNPHGSGFDARAAWARNPGICQACHLGSPIPGG